MHTLTISRVSQIFSGKSIFTNLSYQFSQGHSYALTGPSGAGKSTLLYLLAGLETPTSGHILFSGTDLGSLSPTEKAQLLYQHIGCIYQVPHLIDELSLAENVMIKGLIANQPYKESHEKARELLSQVGLADKYAQRPRSLSGGEQQRVAIARALFSGPSFILADEPTAHLDEAMSQVVINLLLSYQHESGIIMVSHNTRIAEQFEHTLFLADGTLFDHIPPSVAQKEYYV